MQAFTNLKFEVMIHMTYFRNRTYIHLFPSNAYAEAVYNYYTQFLVESFNFYSLSKYKCDGEFLDA